MDLFFQYKVQCSFFNVKFKHQYQNVIKKMFTKFAHNYPTVITKYIVDMYLPH